MQNGKNECYNNWRWVVRAGCSNVLVIRRRHPTLELDAIWHLVQDGLNVIPVVLIPAILPAFFLNLHSMSMKALDHRGYDPAGQSQRPWIHSGVPSRNSRWPTCMHPCIHHSLPSHSNIYQRHCGKSTLGPRNGCSSRLTTPDLEQIT